jgi:hypothetical protein
MKGILLQTTPFSSGDSIVHIFVKNYYTKSDRTSIKFIYFHPWTKHVLLKINAPALVSVVCLHVWIWSGEAL